MNASPAPQIPNPHGDENEKDAQKYCSHQPNRPGISVLIPMSQMRANPASEMATAERIISRLCAAGFLRNMTPAVIKMEKVIISSNSSARNCGA